MQVEVIVHIEYILCPCRGGREAGGSWSLSVLGVRKSACGSLEKLLTPLQYSPGTGARSHNWLSPAFDRSHAVQSKSMLLWKPRVENVHNSPQGHLGIPQAWARCSSSCTASLLHTWLLCHVVSVVGSGGCHLHFHCLLVQPSKLVRDSVPFFFYALSLAPCRS